MKRNGNAERRRREDRGAEDADGVGCWEGLGRGNMVSFGAFWVVFFTVQLPVLHAKPEFNRYRRIKAVMVSR